MLSIGCHQYSIPEWKEKYKSVGSENSYQSEQIKEYYNYILMAEMFHNFNYSIKTEA